MYKSNLPQITNAMRQARSNGLVAAALVVENEVKRGLAGGYTSGNFVTGTVLGSVTHSEPEEDARGAFILVYTNVVHALFWELGHQNIFTRRFERVEIWWPAAVNTRAQQLEAFQRHYAGALGGLSLFARPPIVVGPDKGQLGPVIIEWRRL